jgi:hypothetical protein
MSYERAFTRRARPPPPPPPCTQVRRSPVLNHPHIHERWRRGTSYLIGNRYESLCRQFASRAAQERWRASVARRISSTDRMDNCVSIQSHECIVLCSSHVKITRNIVSAPISGVAGAYSNQSIGSSVTFGVACSSSACEADPGIPLRSQASSVARTST